MGSGISRSSNSFQVSMHSSGQVDLTFLSMDRISMATRVVGISGGAMPSVWMPSDLSQAPVCVDSVVEVFGFGHPFDMEMSTLSLVPRATDQVVPPTMQYWEACGNNLEGNDLPVDPYSPGSETIFFTSGGSQVVYFKDGMHFPFFGTDYRHVHVGIDGYLTFDQEDLKPVKSLDDHFRLKRISVFSSPVNHSNPTRVVKVSYSRDRVAITYMDSGSSPNPAMFQVELRASGTIVLSWLHVPRLESPIVGISNGMARLATWQPTSFSSIMGSCD